MVARLELQNGLAPIQEYGRHYTNMNRQKKAPSKDQEPTEEQAAVIQAGDKNFNDQYYDLDDGFIDDDAMGFGLQEEMGADLLVGDTCPFEDSETRNRGEVSAMMRRE